MKTLFWLLCLIGMPFIVLAQHKKKEEGEKDYKSEITYTNRGYVINYSHLEIPQLLIRRFGLFLKYR